LSVGSIPVADDVAGGESRWSDETEISGRFSPSDDCWWRGRVWVLVDEITPKAGRLLDVKMKNDNLTYNVPSTSIP
jgi:hypothetical protein